MNKFEKWFNSINESLTSPVKVEPEVNNSAANSSDSTASVSSSRKDIMLNVDDIISSLENLSKELTEELAKTDEELFSSMGITEEILNEAGDPGMIKQIITSIKAVSAQKKVNKAKINKVALEIAKDEAPNKEQKIALQQKEAVIKKQIDALQAAVDKRFSNKGEYVANRIASAKIKGEMEVLKQYAGADITSNQADDIKQRMAKIQQRYKENQEAFKELEPSEEEKKEAVTQAKKDREEQVAEKQRLEAEKEKLKQQKETDKEPAADTETDKEPDADTESDKEPAADTEADKEQKNSKEDKLKRLEDLLAKAKESGDEERIKKVQDLIDKVSAKEAWQLKDTKLGSLLEMEINKLEVEMILNESKYVLTDVKTRFKRLTS